MNDDHATLDAADQTWWDALSPEEQEAERVAARKGLADIEDGRTRPAEEVYRRVRARYPALPSVTAATEDS